MDWSLSPGVTRVFLVRHGETEVSTRRVIAGRLDVALSKRGLEQAHAAGARLAKAPLTAVYTSTSRRALDTAWAIAGPHGLTRYRTRTCARSTSAPSRASPYDAVAEGHPEIAATWLTRPHEIEFPGGESAWRPCGDAWSGPSTRSWGGILPPRWPWPATPGRYARSSAPRSGSPRSERSSSPVNTDRSRRSTSGAPRTARPRRGTSPRPTVGTSRLLHYRRIETRDTTTRPSPSPHSR